MATATRIYKVAGTRLVRAANVAQARNHVARESIAVEVASQDDLVTMVGGGTKVETAGEHQAEGDDQN